MPEGVKMQRSCYILFRLSGVDLLDLICCHRAYNFIPMADKASILNKLKEKQGDQHREAVKSFSQRPRKKNEGGWTGRVEGIPESIGYIVMREKFEQMYRHIEKLTLQQHDQLLVRSVSKQNDFQRSASIDLAPEELDPEMVEVEQKCSLPSVTSPQLEISTVADGLRRARGAPIQTQFLRKSSRKKKVHDLPVPVRPKLSNNIKDYLSVEKISIKEMEDSLLSNKMRMLKNYNQSNLLAFSNPELAEKSPQPLPRLKSIMTDTPVRERPENVFIRKPSKFKAPFQLYYYRDFMWRVAFSNEFLVEAVEEYESKVKYYVGPGNNSNLIKGIMKRRPWFQLTDKIQDAQFVWTQIKNPTIFQAQKKGDLVVIMPAAEKQGSSEVSLAKKQLTGKQFSLFNVHENEKWNSYWAKHMDKERSIKEHLKARTKILGVVEHPLGEFRPKLKVHNHFTNNFLIGNKKALFQTMTEYYNSNSQEVFDYLPLTFHIKNGLEDDQYLKFLQHFYSISKGNKANPESLNKFNAWIVKPGENTNRGNGIIVCLDLNQIKTILKKKQKHNDGSYKTYILQKYIERPLLYRRRKFDIRHYIMLNCVNGRMKGYWYRYGYVRTTSSEYTLEISSGSVHLTNDAVQKNLPDYGKFEKGNKITYEELEAFIKKSDPSFNFFEGVYPKMKKIATNAIHASALSIDPLKRVNNFEVFGLDFMIDASYNVWLIEVNTNPCLETTCPVLNKIIPRFIENTFQICLDPLFPAPLNFEPKYQDYYKNTTEENDFELVFDERVDRVKGVGEELLATPEEDEDTFDDDGEDFQD